MVVNGNKAVYYFTFFFFFFFSSEDTINLALGFGQVLETSFSPTFFFADFFYPQSSKQALHLRFMLVRCLLLSTLETLVARWRGEEK